jgi:(2Fe-2S) ferredoxin
MKAALLSRGLHKTARACSASCLDLCEEGAAIVLEPDHVVYGNVTLDDVDAIADALAKGEVVERLVVHRGASGASGAHGAPASEGASPPSPGGAEGGA